jgi:hypothetical protein
MNSQKTPADFKTKTEYIKTVLDSITNRRDAVENKSSILLASNAILISAVIGFGVPMVANGVGEWLTWLRVILTISILAAVIISCLFAAEILNPLFGKNREDLLDLPEHEYNLFWFGKIAEYRKSEYLNEVSNLTEIEIFNQYASDVHNITRILVYRYRLLNRSRICFIVGIVIFAILAVTKLFSR